VVDETYVRRSCAYTTEDCTTSLDVYVCKQNFCNDVPNLLQTDIYVVALSSVIANVLV